MDPPESRTAPAVSSRRFRQTAHLSRPPVKNSPTRAGTSDLSRRQLQESAKATLFIDRQSGGGQRLREFQTSSAFSQHLVDALQVRPMFPCLPREPLFTSDRAPQQYTYYNSAVRKAGSFEGTLPRCLFARAEKKTTGKFNLRNSR
jgi:hypothetical protein